MAWPRVARAVMRDMCQAVADATHSKRFSSSGEESCVEVGIQPRPILIV